MKLWLSQASPTSLGHAVAKLGPSALCGVFGEEFRRSTHQRRCWRVYVSTAVPATLRHGA
ncbi:uncharacterized protein LDX57_010194 [Aspergillus melleus]|uniref:uncharacterized protein n=1 Tax=Aspergillus melleus TaxID=138277 RepID=UPI001E8E98D3|nr:uncharacterized protein LDX57_010194 [Aspergillus melleus]KAH8432563.1 hypothetical protein LDX57_010194 [Aspergillus melleus]